MIMFESFEMSYFEEPEIHFRDGQSDVWPKRGLAECGPKLKNTSHRAINVAAIGDPESIRLLNELFLDMREVVHPDVGEEDINPWHYPFPGLNEWSNLGISIAFPDRWRSRIWPRDISSVEAHDSRHERFDEFLSLVRGELEWLATDDPTPDVIVVCIPPAIMETLQKGSSSGDVIVDGRNLHSQIKIAGMQNGIPTQLIKPDTLESSNDVEKATKCWNLSVGLLYKAQRGYPWKTKQLEEGTCYAGVSFYQDKDGDGNVVRAALTHVFARRDYNVLQSEPLQNVSEDENGQPHVSKQGAQQIAEQIVDYYETRNNGSKPERLVIHKSSSFWDVEREGFLAGASDVHLHDYVHLRTGNTGVRLFPEGEFPPLRGTALSIPADDVHYLYTTGYVPEVATYEGSNIPEPIEIRPDEQCESDQDVIFKDILLLTKLDWNTTEFAIKEPVTLKVARKVSSVISDEGIDPSEAEKNYYYYM